MVVLYSMDADRPFVKWLKEYNPQHYIAILRGVINEEVMWNEYILGWLDDCEN